MKKIFTLVAFLFVSVFVFAQTNYEIDVYNGLLLTPSLDVAFDAGYISFTDNGEIIISSRFTNADAKALGIGKSQKLCRVVAENRPYLKYHRENVFKNN